MDGDAPSSRAKLGSMIVTRQGMELVRTLWEWLRRRGLSGDCKERN